MTDKKQVKGLEVTVQCKDPKRHIEEVEFALKEFRKLIKKSDLMQELRRREHYLSPSKAKRFKKNESIKRRKREERKQEWQSRKENL